MEDWKPLGTLMVTTYKLSQNDESPKENQTWYHSMISSLLYVTTSRPDVMQIVGLVSRFQYAPKETHVKAVK